MPLETILRARRHVFFCSALFLNVGAALAQSDASLSQRIQKVITRPEFAHANFGIEFSLKLVD